MARFIIILLCLIAIFPALGQSDQNFKIESSNSNCDSLAPYYQSIEQAHRVLFDHRFRLEESMETSRISGFRKVYFKSCDRVTGFLLIQVDEEWIIFRDVPAEVWNAYKSSKDL